MNNIFKKYKNKHAGERVFLIANGPSLADTDLALLENENTIAMNRISLLYKKFPNWRPTYYLFASTNVKPEKPWSEKWLSSVLESVASEKTVSFIGKFLKPFIDPQGNSKSIVWIESLSENKPDIIGKINKNCFSTNIEERIDKTGTTMNIALQLCYYMGFSEIVFVGADLGWKKDSGSDSDPNHFDKDYTADISRPYKANNQMRNIHSLAIKYFKEAKKDTKFYNASLKTVLDVYPIIDFTEYVKNNKVIERFEDLEHAKSFWDSKAQYDTLT